MKMTCCLQKYLPERRTEYRDAEGRKAKRQSSLNTHKMNNNFGEKKKKKKGPMDILKLFPLLNFKCFLLMASLDLTVF